MAYDYIVVGGGTAGLVVANRLTEDPDVHVLVIEAGENRNSDPKITIPGLATTTYNDTEYDWSFRTVPQKGLHGKTVDLSRGKLLGGSSAINILALIYPHRSTFDAWENELGNKGWGWKDVQPYFNKALTTQDPTPEAVKDLHIKPIDRNLHGSTGPVQSSYSKFFGEPAKAWIPTFQKLGLEAVKDSKTGEPWGAYTSVATIDGTKGQRSHAGTAYHEPASKRPNYHVLTSAMVEKILIEKESSGDAVVKGVQYKKDGKTETVSASNDVILSAGVFQTPQLLELSGVGNPEILSKQGIETKVENRFVGENLQDHPLSGLCFEVRDGIPTTDMIRDPKVIEYSMGLYQKDHTGPLASPFGGCAAMLPVREWVKEAGASDLTKVLDEQLSQPGLSDLPSIDRQYAAHRKSLENSQEASAMFALGTIQMHFQHALQKEIFSLSAPENYIVVLASLTSPLSRGSTHINSADPLAKPTIDPRYLSHPLDVEVYGRQIRQIEEFVKTEPLKSVLKEGGAKLPREYDLSTVEGAKEHIRKHVISNNHGSSSCAMMPKELGGVVDTSLRVYGVKGLRIVDASIFPIIPKGNPQSSVYAIAEKAADVIKSRL